MQQPPVWRTPARQTGRRIRPPRRRGPAGGPSEPKTVGPAGLGSGTLAGRRALPPVGPAGIEPTTSTV